MTTTKLPKPNTPVTVADLLALALEHGKDDIVAVLESNPPDDVFISDGCSMWPDKWFGSDLYPACFWHDVRYWSGLEGDDLARLKADAELMVDVAASASVNLGVTMFSGVRMGGTEHLNTPFRWGYGR